MEKVPNHDSMSRSNKVKKDNFENLKLNNVFKAKKTLTQKRNDNDKPGNNIYYLHQRAADTPDI